MCQPIFACKQFKKTDFQIGISKITNEISDKMLYTESTGSLHLAMKWDWQQLSEEASIALKLREKMDQIATFMETEWQRKKRGVWLTALLSVFLVIGSMPFINWFYLKNFAKLFKALKLESTAGIYHGYSIFNLLNFVQTAVAGKLGMFAAILLILLVACWALHVTYIVRSIQSRYSENHLSIYAVGKSAMLLTILLCVGAQIFVIFANQAYGVPGFSLNPLVYVEFAFSVTGYVMVKLMEAPERKLYREHGLATELKRNWPLFLMLVPTAVYFIINNYMPMIGIYFSFINFSFTDGLWGSPFVGFKNFEFLFQSQMWRLVRNTLLYNTAFILLGNCLQIFFAVLISQLTQRRFKKITQTMMFMPYFVSYVMVNVLVYALLEYDYGAINSALVSLGFERLDFYNSPKYWPFIIVIVNLWKGLGYGMVVYLATITSIDPELYAAAKVDGANIFQQIRYITLPHLKPTFILLLVYAVGSIMKGNFELFYQLVGNNGILFSTTDILDTYVYRVTVSQPLDIGLGAAAGLFQSVFGFVVVMVTNWFIKRKNPEQALF